MKDQIGKLCFASHPEQIIYFVLLIIISPSLTFRKTLGLEPFADKWKAFGWDVREVDGHGYEAILDSLKNHLINLSFNWPYNKRKRRIFYDSVLWHYRSPQEEIAKQWKNLENSNEDAFAGQLLN